MIYFASDFHLGIDAGLTSIEREKKIVRWLSFIEQDAEIIFLVGDIFDFWFEYPNVIPKGYTRLLGKLREMRDRNIDIRFFSGNHDTWMFDFFPNEFGIPVYHRPIVETFGNRKFLIGHGDGLGPGDKGYKRLKKIISEPNVSMAFF